MIMKCRDMDRVIAESSQKLLHGGMRTRDWFSDKLEEEEEKWHCNNMCCMKKPPLFSSCEHLLTHSKEVPVESIAHLNGDQDRQGHGHGRSSLKDLTVKAGKVLILIVALHEV